MLTGFLCLLLGGFIVISIVDKELAIKILDNIGYVIKYIFDAIFNTCQKIKQYYDKKENPTEQNKNE